MLIQRNRGMSLSRPNDFGADVLAILKRRKVTFYGQPPWYLEINPRELKMWFYGHKDGKPWARGFSILNRDDLDCAVLKGDANALADAFEQAIDHAQVRFK